MKHKIGKFEISTGMLFYIPSTGIVIGTLLMLMGWGFQSPFFFLMGTFYLSIGIMHAMAVMWLVLLACVFSIPAMLFAIGWQSRKRQSQTV